MSAGYAGARYCFSRRNRRFSFAWSLGSGGAWDGLSCRTRGRLSLAVSVRSLWTLRCRCRKVRCIKVVLAGKTHERERRICSFPLGSVLADSSNERFLWIDEFG